MTNVSNPDPVVIIPEVVESDYRSESSGQNTNTYIPIVERKSWLVTLLLCIFLGGLGIHRFYTGHVFLGVLYLLTGGFFGIGWFFDLILIIFGFYTDRSGAYLG